MMSRSESEPSSTHGAPREVSGVARLQLGVPLTLFRRVCFAEPNTLGVQSRRNDADPNPRWSRVVRERKVESERRGGGGGARV